MTAKSTILYLIVFFTSFVFLKLSEKCRMTLSKKTIGKSFILLNNERSKHTISYNNIFSLSLVFGGLLIPCVFAALRSMTVGVDIKVYVTPFYDFALNHNFIQLIEKANSATGLAFAALIYICAKFFNVHILLFLIEVLIIFPLYHALRLLNEKLSPAVGMLIFYFLFYNLTLCVMRQGIAMSFILLSYAYFEKKKCIPSIVFSIVAVMFHKSSALIILFIFIVLLILNSKKKRTNLILFVFFLAIFFVLYPYVIHFLIDLLTKFSYKYALYLIKYNKPRDWSQIPTTDFLSKTLMLIAILIACKKVRAKDNFTYFLMLLVFVGRYFMIFNANFYESTRVAIYFDYFLILLVPFVSQKWFSKKNGSSMFASLCFIGITSLYWLYFMMIVGAYGTNNYMFYFE